MLDVRIVDHDGSETRCEVTGFDALSGLLEARKGGYKSMYVKVLREKAENKPVEAFETEDEGFTIVPAQTLYSEDLTARNGFTRQEVQL